MNERVRMQYLQAMGITMYVPRFVLSGAKPSTPASLPLEIPAPAQRITGLSAVADPASTHLAPLEQPQPRLGEPVEVGRLVEALRPEPLRRTLAEPVQKVVSGSDEKHSGQSEVRFTLQIWHLSPQITVIDSHRPRQGLPTSKLLHNMLFALGKAAELPAPELLSWPLMPQLPAASLSQARDMVSAYLTGRWQNAPVAQLWLLGKDALLACSDHDLALSDSTTQITIPSLPVPVLVMPSLADMLYQGELKADVWRLLRQVYGVH